ncbi:GNAT family N-acetyltransferase [Geomicrobium sp. JCM 19055]|uniref:GNAT family N-acetyltransferase n=1 Tax=Geomicrobium sp. JCM 19055 TaxID=1460649 RepID=UPI00045ED393|nr:GNAT family N-acetyltransferase [Geomicrobium sp. JCM 19055]GAK00784.1 acetyltransferase, GNAT family [Geomicrobium sp. JCM 19055]
MNIVTSTQINHEKLNGLHKRIFDSDNVVEKFRFKPEIVATMAWDKEELIGYKLGYAQNESTFYSWLGGVHPERRKQGIGEQLLLAQHRELKKRGFTHVETKTMNRWRDMLLLNIRSGFCITGTHTNESDDVMIMLRKRL